MAFCYINIFIHRWEERRCPWEEEEKAWKALHRKRGAGDCPSLTQSSHDTWRNRRSSFQVKRCSFDGRRATLVVGKMKYMVHMSKFQNLFCIRGKKGDKREKAARRRQIECLRRRKRRRRATTRSGATLAPACAHWNWHSRGHLSLLTLRARDTVFAHLVIL